jgi:hypothetical protein
MIHLEKTDKQWIKMCKLHYQDKYPRTGSWVNNLKPLFFEIYGWNPDEDRNYHDYLNCMFNRLLDLYLKIAEDKSGNNNQLRGIFNAAFYKSISREEELPIERAIAELCSLIQFNQVIMENGEHRYEL